MALIDLIEVEQHFIVVTFNKIPKAVSLKNDNISLYTTDATPVKVENVFEQIVLADHYDSIRRRLTLYFEDLPDTQQELDLRFQNIVLYDGSVVSDNIIFDYPYNNGSIEPPREEPVPIVDKSIRADAFVDVDDIDFFLAGTNEFNVESVTPENGSIFVEGDENEGRITVEFSKMPSLAFVNDRYFKMQRKPINTTFVRWETVVNTDIRRDSELPLVYISLPALESETVVYEEPGYNYFESGYKYRLKLHSSIATEE